MDLDGLPDRRTALKAKDGAASVWITRTVARGLYFCKRCKGRIDIGDESIVVRYDATRAGVKTNHFLYHRSCFERSVSPRLTEVEKVPAEKAEKAAVNKTLRRRRYQQKKRGR